MTGICLLAESGAATIDQAQANTIRMAVPHAMTESFFKGGLTIGTIPIRKPLQPLPLPIMNIGDVWFTIGSAAFLCHRGWKASL